MSPRSCGLVRLIVLASLVCSLLQSAPVLALEVTYSVTDGVTAADEDYVREGIALAERYVARAFGGSIDDDLVVNVRSIQYRDNPGLLAFAGGDFLVVFTGSPVWQSLPPALRMQTVVHEYIHIYQRDALGLGADVSPAWLIEGMADYFAYQAIASAGIATMDDADEFARWVAGVERDRMPRLAAIESFVDYQASDGAVYQVSQLAVTRLLGRQPEERARQYFDLVAAGTPWQSAFPIAFDVELDAFYQSFDAWIVDMVAPRRPPAVFSFVEPRRVKAEITLESISTPVERGEQVVVIGRTEPAVSCNFELRDGVRNRVERAPTFADQTGAVFWVATIPESMPAGAAFVVAACGGDTDRLAFEVIPRDPGS